MSQDGLIKNYKNGIYKAYKFNKYDSFLRKNLGLYASQLVIKEALPLIYRQFANHVNLEKMALLEPSQVFAEEEMFPELVFYMVLYIPIKPAQQKNKANLSEEEFIKKATNAEQANKLLEKFKNSSAHKDAPIFKDKLKKNKANLSEQESRYEDVHPLGLGMNDPLINPSFSKNH